MSFIEIESAYMAGVADSDGSFSICKRKTNKTLSGYSYSISFQLTWKKDDNSFSIMNSMALKYGGNVYVQKRHDGHFKKGSEFLQYYVCSAAVVKLINDILPFLKLKKDQAELVLELENNRQIWKKNHKGLGRAKPLNLWKKDDFLYEKMTQIKGHKIRVFEKRTGKQ